MSARLDDARRFVVESHELRTLVCLCDKKRALAVSSVHPAAQMNQAKLFENEKTFLSGMRKYASSQHYHYVLPSDADENLTYGGSRMVQSTITDMLATVSEAGDPRGL